MAKIVVVGAGVSGLTTALQLLRSDAGHQVTIIAKHMPGDHDIEYCSPWAGANFLPRVSQSTPGTRVNDYEKITWPELVRLARDHPESGIHFQELHDYCREKDNNTAGGQWLRGTQWYKDLVSDFRDIPSSDLPKGMSAGIAFTSVCINAALYLPYLASQCLQRGATIRRSDLTHITAAASQHASGAPADIVINCTGLASLRLGGVRDAKLYPIRGQVVVVRNSHPVMTNHTGVDAPGSVNADDEAFYIMTRAAGGGCVLGGCVQRGSWDPEVDMVLARRIMQRAVDAVPALVEPGQGVDGLSVIRHGVGLRPARQGGVRVEAERIGGVQVVHNYGHGGYGYQTSWGAAKAVQGLVEEALQGKTKAKL